MSDSTRSFNDYTTAGKHMGKSKAPNTLRNTSHTAMATYSNLGLQLVRSAASCIVALCQPLLQVLLPQCLAIPKLCLCLLSALHRSRNLIGGLFLTLF